MYSSSVVQTPGKAFFNYTPSGSGGAPAPSKFVSYLSQLPVWYLRYQKNMSVW